MDKRVKGLVDFTRNKWGLENYYLYTYHFYRTLNALNETTYTLCMEWYPSHITHQEDEDCNPEGTAAIEINMKNHQFEKVIFVGEKNFTNRSVIRSIEWNDIIKFIEGETGLKYGNQFRLVSQEEKEYRFKSCVNGVAVSPYGSIEIKFDEKGKMTFFSQYGPFPSVDEGKAESFSLQLKDVEKVAKEQLKLFVFPSRKQKKQIPIYCLEEIFIKNDQLKTFPFNNLELVYKIDEKINWEESKKKSFKRRQIDWQDNITADQVFSGEIHPDLIPIPESEIKKCIIAVKECLSQIYSGDSGKWILKTLKREKGYIIAKLGDTNQDNFVFKQKLSLFINSKTFKVLNYMDNKPFIESYENFEEAGSINIHFEKAYELIKSKIELTPVYVYDFEKKSFTLCGKIDCNFGINGTNGEIVNLDHL